MSFSVFNLRVLRKSSAFMHCMRKEWLSITFDKQLTQINTGSPSSGRICVIPKHYSLQTSLWRLFTCNPKHIEIIWFIDGAPIGLVKIGCSRCSRIRHKRHIALKSLAVIIGLISIFVFVLFLQQESRLTQPIELPRDQNRIYILVCYCIYLTFMF